MNQDPEHEDYDDDEYNYYPEYNEYGYPINSKKFNVDWAAWEQWLSKAIKEIVEEDKNVWVFGHKLFDDIKKTKKSHNQKLNDKYFMYLGSNHYDEAVWKSKYFINNHLDLMYKNHISTYPAHFLRQPSYYRGMFENLN